MENLYKILNCDETAPVQELKKSYQFLALKYHPDKTKPSNSYAEKFIKINHAWTILRDAKLREQYDAKWRERCLAQAYPIQDTVDFEEFEKMEHFDHNIDEGSLEDERTVAKKVDDENCLSKGGNCDKTVDSSNSGGQFCKVTSENVESDDLTEEDLEKDNSGLPVKQQNAATADMNDLPPLDDVIYMYNCRCGGSYILTGVDVKLKFDIVCCDTCSLSIQVMYNEDDNDYNK